MVVFDSDSMCWGGCGVGFEMLMVPLVEAVAKW